MPNDTARGSDAVLIEAMARAYQDTADAFSVDEWQIDPRDCERRCAAAALTALCAARPDVAALLEKEMGK